MITQSFQEQQPLAAIESWFAARNWEPFAFQRAAWDAYARGASGLIHAATGTGKTYAAWLGLLAEGLQEAHSGRHAPPLRAIWLTPLRALAADTAAALLAPINELGLNWTLETRTGDTAASTRARQRQRLPTALVTTPESLTLLLARSDSSELFRDLRMVVVDEWHELLSTKRGTQTELALARLRTFAPALRTWGLSATLGNLDIALQTLVGVGPQPQAPELIRGLLPKQLTVDSLIPATVERFPWAGHLGLSMLPQVIAAIEEGRTALVFTNTRAQTEIWYQALLEARPEWAGEIALHHGSLARDVRDWVERGLKEGALRCVVSTSSLDLGVDFAPVDRVLQIGSPKGVARLLQRAGRSGHAPGRPSRVSCVPTNAFELIEVAAVRRAVAEGHIESRQPLDEPLDVLTQHLVTCATGGGFVADELLAEVRTTYAYRNLNTATWQWTLDFAAHGGPALRNYDDYQRIIERDGRYQIASDRLARRQRMAIGTIVGEAALHVQFLRGGRLGSIEESFVSRLKRGDRFVFAGRTLEFVRLRDMTVWVRLASSTKGTVPRWSGGRMPLSTELASAVRELLQDAHDGVFDTPELDALRPILSIQQRWSAIPAADELLIERVKTREGQHLFFFPFEGRAVHEGLAALFAYRLAQVQPISFTLAINDYGFELLSPDLAPLEQLLQAKPGLFDTATLADDIRASLNATEMERRQFREIARVAGLVFQGFPGEKSLKQLQASSGLIFDVFEQYDPANLLLGQAEREVLDRQLEQGRLRMALERLGRSRLILREVKRPTPFSFPLLVNRMRETLTSEKLADRIKKMQLQLEAADRK